MKKISLLAILILPIFCASELFLEITKGSEDPSSGSHHATREGDPATVIPTSPRIK